MSVEPESFQRGQSQVFTLDIAFQHTTRILSRSTDGSISSLVSDVGSKIWTGVDSCVAPGMAVCRWLSRTGSSRVIFRGCVTRFLGAVSRRSVTLQYHKFWGEGGLWFGDAVVGQNFFPALHVLARMTWGVGKVTTSPKPPQLF